MDTRHRTELWKFMQTTSVPLRRITAEERPNAFGSGCLLRIKERLFLLSALHVTGSGEKDASGRWMLQLNYNEKTMRTEVLWLPPLWSVARVTNAEISVDLSFAPIHSDIDCRFQHWTPANGCVDDRPRHVFDIGDICRPKEDQTYGFAGEVLPEFITDVKALVTEHHTNIGLIFSRTEGDYHYFRLRAGHPGHARFQGCSGAPIVDEHRRVVALLCGGCSTSSEVWGVDLGFYQVALKRACEVLDDEQPISSASTG